MSYIELQVITKHGFRKCFFGRGLRRERIFHKELFKNQLLLLFTKIKPLSEKSTSKGTNELTRESSFYYEQPCARRTCNSCIL